MLVNSTRAGEPGITRIVAGNFPPSLVWLSTSFGETRPLSLVWLPASFGPPSLWRTSTSCGEAGRSSVVAKVSETARVMNDLQARLG